MITKSVLLFLLFVLGNSDTYSSNVTSAERHEFLKFLDLPDNHYESLGRDQTRCRVPPFVKDLYRTKIRNRKILLKNPSHSEQDIVRVFFPKVRIQLNTYSIIYELTFNLSSIRLKDEAILHADLRLHTKREKAKGLVRFCTLALFSQWSKDNRRERHYRNTAPTFIKFLPLSGNFRLIQHNVLSDIKKHVREEEEKIIQFKIYLYGKRLPKSWINSKGKKKPFLVIYSQRLKKEEKTLNSALVANLIEPLRSRTKRANNNYCKRARMFVKFSTLKYDWVIAPRGFSAYTCEGTCPEVLTPHNNPTNHAILQSLVHHRYSKHVPQPSCVPTALDSLTILYRDVDDSITLREFSGMVALECGCR